MISIAVARGRLGSALRTQLTLRIEERTTSKSDALYVLPEPKIPCTQRVVWPACIPVRVARSSPGKCPFGARRAAIQGQGGVREAQSGWTRVGREKSVVP